MRILVVCFLAASVFVIVNGQEIDHKYDNFDVDEVLNNQRILKNYIKCMLDKGPCTPEGKDFRSKFYSTIKNDYTLNYFPYPSSL